MTEVLCSQWMVPNRKDSIPRHATPSTKRPMNGLPPNIGWTSLRRWRNDVWKAFLKSRLWRDKPPVMQPIPPSLAPFFQEYDLSLLNPEKDSFTIIERTLQFGNRSELRWLFTIYSLKQIRDWVRYFGKDCLPQPHLNFWQLILDINE